MPSKPGSKQVSLMRIETLMLLIASVSSGIIEKEKLDIPEHVNYFEIPLDPTDKIHLYWTVDYEEEVITMEIRARITESEWIAIGFSDRGDVANADFCLLWTDRNGRHQFQDIWTDEASYVATDDYDDCQLLSLKRKGFVTRYAWTRKFDTCDSQDYLIEGGTTHVIYATGHGPVRRIEGIRLSNENHGFQRAELLKNMDTAPKFPEDSKILTIHNNKVNVPNVETTYHCSLHILPEEFEKKQHIVQFSAAIQKGNEGVVHHMEIFHCEVPANKKLPPWNGPCQSSSKPSILEACKRVLAAWAMGALPFNYPKEAGLPVGGPDFSRYVMLEVHYNNPSLKPDYVDSSGVKLVYTSTLRKYDAGVMELGLEYTNKMAIPPKQKSFLLSGYCVPECTRAGLPPEGIIIFGSQLHTHLTGTQVYTRMVRGGRELPELNRDNHYSTHFQEIRHLRRRVQVMPGDGLITTCRYNTEDRENITLGGFAISEEMCVNYVHYFPKTDLEVCKSSIDSDILESYFRYMRHYGDEEIPEDADVGKSYQSIHWSQSNSDFLHHLYMNAPLSMQCNESSGDRFPGYWNGIPRIEVLYPLPKPKRHCSNRIKEYDNENTEIESN